MHPPAIFHVNWFRKNAQGKFLWPGFGENLRVLAWILDAASGKVSAKPTEIGGLPRLQDLQMDGLSVPAEDMNQLLTIDTAAWDAECQEIQSYLAEFGDRTPAALLGELAQTRHRLQPKDQAA